MRPQPPETRIVEPLFNKSIHPFAHKENRDGVATPQIRISGPLPSLSQLRQFPDNSTSDNCRSLTRLSARPLRPHRRPTWAGIFAGTPIETPHLGCRWGAESARFAYAEHRLRTSPNNRVELSHLMSWMMRKLPNRDGNYEGPRGVPKSARLDVRN